MKIKDIQADKLSLITWITQLQDVSTINKLISIKEDSFNIAEWQKEEVMNRLGALEKNPESAIDFDQMIDRVENKYGL